MMLLISGILCLSVLGVWSAPTTLNETRIVGGSEAPRGAYPWQISLQARNPNNPRQTKHICGGSIINSQWVVTASHCTQPNPDPGSYIVIAGEHDFTVNEGSEQAFNVIKLILHESYNPKTMDNDICLLKMDRQFVYNKYVAPIATLSKGQAGSIKVGQNCAASGWGDLYHKGYPPTILNHLGMPILSLQTCVSAYAQVNTVTNRMVCAGHTAGGHGVCQGDSGGPLACILNNDWVLVGVTSWGVGCAEVGFPGLFANVAYFDNWISSTVQYN